MPAPLADAELLGRLIGFNTVSRHSNLPCADFIADYLDRPGVRVANNLSADGTKTNLVIQLGPEPNSARDGLVLSGHMDVVPAAEDDWQSDPFVLTDRGDRWVARGASDMKGFLALAINRAAAIDPATLAHPLALVFTYDEELGTLGARHLVETWPDVARLPRRTVIGEPTALRVVRMHKGHLKLTLSFRGRGAHSGYPHLGVNAIEPAALAVVTLRQLRQQLERERPQHAEHFDPVPYVALNVAQIRGGVADNIVPDRCEVVAGLRLLPGQSSVEMVARVRAALSAALPDTPYTLTVAGDSPPMLLDAASDIHAMLCAEVGQDDTASVSFATDAGWLQSAGMECVVFGPGSIEVAHKPNEFLPKQEFARAGQVIDHLLARYCHDAA